ncbi:hypothetical protein LTR95_011922 [Oleoguttula sp. CCFEE 5521]
MDGEPECRDYEQCSKSRLLATLEQRGITDINTALIKLLQCQDRAEELRRSRAPKFMGLPPEIRVRVYEVALHGLELQDRLKIPALLQVSRQEREDFAPQATSASSLMWLLLEEGDFLCHIRHFRIILATDDEARHGDGATTQFDICTTHEGYCCVVSDVDHM